MKPVHVLWNFEGAVLDTNTALASAFDLVLGQNFKLHHSLSELLFWLKVDAEHCATMVAKHYQLDEAALLQLVLDAYDALSLPYLQPLPGAEACCELVLQSGGKNVLVSLSDQRYCERFLIHHDLDHYFTRLESQTPGFVHAPTVDSIKRIIRTHQMEPERVYAVATTAVEVEAAFQAKVKAFFLCPLGAVQTKAYRNISKLSELESYLRQVLLN